MNDHLDSDVEGFLSIFERTCGVLALASGYRRLDELRQPTKKQILDQSKKRCPQSNFNNVVDLKLEPNLLYNSFLFSIFTKLFTYAFLHIAENKNLASCHARFQLSRLSFQRTEKYFGTSQAIDDDLVDIWN